MLFLDNGNIDRSFLNYRGLHLNHDGSKLLQENIANILTSNKLNEHGRGSPLLIHPQLFQKHEVSKWLCLNVASLTKHLDEIRLLLYDKKNRCFST